MHGLMRVRRCVFALAATVVVALGAPFVTATSAAAHPLGNFTVNRYARVELYRGEAVVHYVLDFAEIPTFQLLEEADSNADRHLDGAELDAFIPGFAAGVAEQLELTGGDGRVDLRVDEATAVASPGQGGLDVLRVALVMRGEASGGGLDEFTFSDPSYDGRPGWREIVVRPSVGADAAVDGAFLVERSDALRSYPADTLDSVPADASVTFAWDPGTGEVAPGSAAVEAAGEVARSDRFSRLLENDRSLGIILLSLLAAFGFGALHALGPGHGKSVVAAYLVGTKGTPRHALALGITVTATHTAAVYGLGFVTLVASDLVAPERAFLYLGVISGAMIVVMGLALFASRLRAVIQPHRESGMHRHGLFGKAHSHLPAIHSHEAAHEHSQEHGHEHTASAAQTGPEARVTWRGLLTLGIAGGILPCPSALVVMLAAISLGQVLFGMLLIVAFSFGLAGVLVAIGLALVLGRRLSHRTGVFVVLRRPGFARAASTFPVLSALAVTVAGAAITYQAWNQPGL